MKWRNDWRYDAIDSFYFLFCYWRSPSLFLLPTYLPHPPFTRKRGGEKAAGRLGGWNRALGASGSLTYGPTHVSLFVSFSILSFYFFVPIIIAFVQQLLTCRKEKGERKKRRKKLYITLTSFSLQWVSWASRIIQCHIMGPFVFLPLSLQANQSTARRKSFAEIITSNFVRHWVTLYSSILVSWQKPMMIWGLVDRKIGR